ncbi:MAG: gliding motility lipoprotein GldD [Bacteroidales bacterium]|nr:gliding motility lipoprotein GldD [Bacteroidales bacterium]
MSLFSTHPIRTVLFIKALLVLFVVSMFSCNNSGYYPKPRGYLRINLPEKNYRQFDSVFPYRFEYARNARLNFEGLNPKNKYWMNIDYPRFKGRIHISYKPVNNQNLYQFTEDARAMAFKHASKAIRIKESFFNDPAKKVYGLAYKIDGRDAASPYQFYLTDSTHHFIRGALYFNVVPNNDSLQPIIDFVLEDVKHMVRTFEWKE